MSATSAEIVSVNPASPDDVVTTVMPAGGIEVDQAVERAAAAARGYARTPAAARGAGLAAVAEALEARSQELAALVVREVGLFGAAAGFVWQDDGRSSCRRASLTAPTSHPTRLR